MAVFLACVGARAQKPTLRMPDNIRETVEYDDERNVYYIGQKLGDTYLSAPTLMTPKEYQKWV